MSYHTISPPSDTNSLDFIAIALNSESYSKEQLVFVRIKENIKELAKKYSSLISTSSRILQDEIKFRNLTY